MINTLSCYHCSNKLTKVVVSSMSSLSAPKYSSTFLRKSWVLFSKIFNSLQCIASCWIEHVVYSTRLVITESHLLEIIFFVLVQTKLYPPRSSKIREDALRGEEYKRVQEQISENILFLRKLSEIDIHPKVKTYFYPNLGFRTYRQHNALIPSVADLHLKLGKIPVYSANPWIDS